DISLERRRNKSAQARQQLSLSAGPLEEWPNRGLSFDRLRRTANVCDGDRMRNRHLFGMTPMITLMRRSSRIRQEPADNIAERQPQRQHHQTGGANRLRS